MESADKKMLGRLDVGEVIVKLQGRWYRPFNVKIPHIPIKKGSISDKKVAELMRPYSTYSTKENNEFPVNRDIPENRDPRKISNEIGWEEIKLINDIAVYRFSGVVERYRRLKWSRRKGNEFKNLLIRKGLIDMEEIPTRSGRVVLLKLTKNGQLFEDNLKENDIKRQGGIIHEFWKDKYADFYRNQGYDIAVEEPVGNGKSVDLVAKKDGFRIAIEIETGRSDIKANIEKCFAANFDKIIMVGTTELIEEKIKKIVEVLSCVEIQNIEVECARKQF